MIESQKYATVKTAIALGVATAAPVSPVVIPAGWTFVSSAEFSQPIRVNADGGPSLVSHVKVPGMQKMLPSESGAFGAKARWQAFLNGLSARSANPGAQVLEEFWQALAREFPRLRPPTVVTEPDDESVALVWDRGRHHFSARLGPASSFSWFYRDRVTEEFDGEDDVPLAELSQLARGAKHFYSN